MNVYTELHKNRVTFCGWQYVTIIRKLLPNKAPFFALQITPGIVRMRVKQEMVNIYKLSYNGIGSHLDI